METHDCWGTMKDDEGTMRNIHSETEKFFMKIFNMFSWLCYDVNTKKNFSVSEAIAHALHDVIWTTPWAMTNFRTGKQRLSLIFNDSSYAKNEKMEKWGVFFSTYRPIFFLASYEWWENANFSAKSQNHEFFFFSCRFSHFPPGSALFGVHVTFDRTERRHGRVDWRRFHIAHIEIFRRNQD